MKHGLSENENMPADAVNSREVVKHVPIRKRSCDFLYISRIILCITATVCIIAFTGINVVEKLHDMRYIQTTVNDEGVSGTTRTTIRVFDKWKDTTSVYEFYYDLKYGRWFAHETTFKTIVSGYKQ